MVVARRGEGRGDAYLPSSTPPTQQKESYWQGADCHTSNVSSMAPNSRIHMCSSTRAGREPPPRTRTRKRRDAHGRTSNRFCITSGKSGTTTSHSHFLVGAAADIAREVNGAGKLGQIDARMRGRIGRIGSLSEVNRKAICGRKMLGLRRYALC